MCGSIFWFTMPPPDFPWVKSKKGVMFRGSGKHLGMMFRGSGNNLGVMCRGSGKDLGVMFRGSGCEQR